MKRTLLGGLVGVLAACVACADTTIKTLGSENGLVIDNVPGALRLRADELDNVHDEVDLTWDNAAARGAVAHRSFVHHGQVIVTVLDAAGTEVYSTPADYNFDNQTRPGVPGLWTVRFEFFGARGRVDVALTSLTGEGDPSLEPPPRPVPSP